MPFKPLSSDLAVRGWFTNEHYVLFFTSVTTVKKADVNLAVRQFLETLRMLGYHVICVHYPAEYLHMTEDERREADERFLEYADHYVSVPVKTVLTGTDYMNMRADNRHIMEAARKVKEICNTFSITVCFISDLFFAPVFKSLPSRIRKVLILNDSFTGRSANMHTSVPATSGPAFLTEEGIRSSCQCADVIAATSQQDYLLAQRLVPEKEVYYYPLVRERNKPDNMIEAGPDHIFQKIMARPFVIPDDAKDHFLNYHDVMVKYLYRYIKDLKDKVFLEIGPDDYLSLARTLKANGAARVIAVQTSQLMEYDLPEGIEFHVVSPTCWNRIEDSSVDMVYGVGVLEHIRHFEEIVDEICRVLKPGGRVLLQGAPLWGASHGHHLVVFDEKTGKIKYDFMQADKNPVDPWMHLALTEQEMRDELVQNKVPVQDAQMIAYMIYHSDIGSNKKLADEIASPFKKEMNVEAVRYLAYPEKNAYYQMARKKYSEIDLDTDCFIIYAQKLI